MKLFDNFILIVFKSIIIYYCIYFLIWRLYFVFGSFCTNLMSSIIHRITWIIININLVCTRGRHDLESVFLLEWKLIDLCSFWTCWRTAVTVTAAVFDMIIITIRKLIDLNSVFKYSNGGCASSRRWFKIYRNYWHRYYDNDDDDVWKTIARHTCDILIYNADWTWRAMKTGNRTYDCI